MNWLIVYKWFMSAPGYFNRFSNTILLGSMFCADESFNYLESNVSENGLKHFLKSIQIAWKIVVGRIIQDISIDRYISEKSVRMQFWYQLHAHDLQNGSGERSDKNKETSKECKWENQKRKKI